MSKQLFATVLLANVCNDVACLRVRVNGISTEKGTIPSTYPNNTLCQVTQFTVRCEDKEGLRPEDIVQAIPGENIIIHICDEKVERIEPEKKYPSLSQILEEICNKGTL